MTEILPLSASQVRWLTSSQVEMKLRLGVIGPVGSLYEVYTSKAGPDLRSPNSEYIPEERRITLTHTQAATLLQTLQTQVSNGAAYQLVPETKYYGKNIQVRAWGAVHEEKLYIFRFCSNAWGLFQVWCVLEEGEQFNVAENSLVSYVLSLPSKI